MIVNHFKYSILKLILIIANTPLDILLTFSLIKCRHLFFSSFEPVSLARRTSTMSSTFPPSPPPPLWPPPCAPSRNHCSPTSAKCEPRFRLTFPPPVRPPGVRRVSRDPPPHAPPRFRVSAPSALYVCPLRELKCTSVK